MKKLISLLPLAICIALTGCSSDTGGITAETSSVQPTWQANPNSNEFQSNPMPNYTPPIQPNYAPSTESGPDYNANVNVNISETTGNCQIVRDANGSPIYSQITRGCYTASTYTVGAQDTLYLISFLVGKSTDDIALLNNFSPTTKLHIGQILRVK